MNTLARFGLLALLGVAATGAMASSTPEEEQNKAMAVRIFEDGLSRGIFNVPYTDDFIGHRSKTSTFTHEEGRKEAIGWRDAFPDLHVVVDHVIAEGDKVAVRWTARGTHTGDGNGLAATGRRVETSGTVLLRFEDGKLAEEWVAGNQLDLMRQLGLMPTRSAAAAAPAAATN